MSHNPAEPDGIITRLMRQVQELARAVDARNDIIARLQAEVDHCHAEIRESRRDPTMSDDYDPDLDFPKKPMTHIRIAVHRTRPDAVLPTQSHASDAGWDLYANADLRLGPHSIARVPAGIHTAIPPGYFALILGRSGLATEGIDVLGGVISGGYRGEWTVVLVNHSPTPQEILHGDRIAQFVVLPVPQVRLQEVDQLPPSPRSSRGLGSTGR